MLGFDALGALPVAASDGSPQTPPTASRTADLAVTLDNVTSSASSGAASVANASVTLGAMVLTGGATPVSFSNLLSFTGSVTVVLLEASCNSGGTEMTRYLSTRPFVTGAADTPAQIAYQPVLAGGISTSESLSIDGTPSLTFGDIDFINVNGEIDAWINDVFINRPVRAYIGSVGWKRTDFQLIFDGIGQKLIAKKRDRLTLSLRDKMSRLNGSISEATFTQQVNTGSTSVRMIPLTFGECHNVEPLLTDPAQLEYQVHNGKIEDIIEVRDNGVPVDVYATVSTGKFTLRSAPFGTVSASVQGDKLGGVYRNTVARLVQLIVTNYGKAQDRFTTNDIDVSNFDNFDSTHPQPVGVYMTDRMNVIDAVHQLAQSVGGQPCMGRNGLLRLVSIDLPPTGIPVMALTETDMLEGSLEATDRTDVSAAVKLGYCRNWLPETNLQSGIPQAHKDLLAEEWLFVTQQDTAVATQYKLQVEPTEEDTFLLTTADASAEALRRLNLRKVQRTTFRFTGFSSLFTLQLGDILKITHHRFGLSSGATGIVIGLAPDWMKQQIDVQVLI